MTLPPESFIINLNSISVPASSEIYKASRLNVIHSVNAIKSALDLTDDNSANNKISVIGGIYNLETGLVEFI